MTASDAVTDLDLFAYADGHLDDDPARKTEVEAALRSSPELTARVDRFVAQNAALRRAYGPVTAEATPERLLAALDTPSTPPMRGARTLAAALALVAVAGAAGWRLAEVADEDGWSAARFAARSQAEYVAGDAAATGGLAASDAAAGASFAGPFDSLRNQVSIRLEIPELSALGLELAGKSASTIGEDHVVRLDYRASDGAIVSLFLTPRWEDTPAEVIHAERDGVAVAYWLDGPLASSIVGRMSGEALESIARRVRDAMRRQDQPPARLNADGPPRRGPRDDVMADTLPPGAGGESLLLRPTRGLQPSAPN
ncbi:MAG: hypothetical protein R6V44_02350 [Paracoccaceae bacterium]